MQLHFLTTPSALATPWHQINTLPNAKACSEAEIQALEATIGQSLPVAYKERFLRPIGQGAGQFLQGEDCFYPHLVDLQTWARELLAEEAFSQALPDDAFVFWMHQGYQFGFFRPSEGEDPPVYYFEEGQEEQEFRRIHDRFTDFLQAEWSLFQQLCGTPIQTLSHSPSPN